jgi:hypothetical protein
VLSAVVGFSPFISNITNQPEYNLWDPLRHFMHAHKFWTSCIVLGILMLNPIFTLFNALIGYFIDSEFKTQLTQLDRLRINIMRHIASVSIEKLRKTFFLLNKSFLVGAAMGLLASCYMLLITLPWLITFNIFQLRLLMAFAWFMTQTFSGGFIPG